jgi:hypothetical protein
MIVRSQLALKTASLATLDKLVDRFPLPPVAPPIRDTSLTHVMRLAAHSTTFIIILYIVSSVNITCKNKEIRVIRSIIGIHK